MSTLDSLSTILFSAIGVYVLFLVYLKVIHEPSIKDLIPADKMEEYNKIKNKHMIVFIIGLLLGFVIVLVKDNKIIETVGKNKYINSITVSDVDDISVL